MRSNGTEGPVDALFGAVGIEQCIVLDPQEPVGVQCEWLEFARQLEINCLPQDAKQFFVLGVAFFSIPTVSPFSNEFHRANYRDYRIPQALQ